MWPLPKIDNVFVGIICTPTTLIYSCIGKKNNNYHLKAYATITLEDGELENLVIHNPTRIKTNTEKFLHANKLGNPFIALACSGPAIQEHFITAPTICPTRAALQIPEFKKCVWDYCYVSPREPEHLFYACGIRREHLAQYQLLFSAAGLNLIAVTTPLMAKMHTYEFVNGTKIRQGQLVGSIASHSAYLETNITSATLEKYLQIPVAIRAQKPDHATLVTALGLFLTGFEQ